MKRTSLYVFVFLAAAFLSFIKGDTGKVSIHMESKTLLNNKVVIIKSDIYYMYNEGSMITHYTYPTDYIYITNKVGEAKVYYPDKNEVYMKTDRMFASESSILYIFLNNKIHDLGLTDVGFKIKDTRVEDGLTITTWSPPVELIEQIGKVELVHENFIPIYIAYYTKKQSLLKKTYYYDYSNYRQFSIPLKITEFNYMANGDSVITKINFSGLKFDSQATGPYFNYKIPDDAKAIQ